MAKGENIFKRKDGRWEARYIKGRELSGKIKYGYCYGKTYREAKNKVTQIRASIAAGKNPVESGSRHHLSFYCAEWLKFSKHGWKESTYVKYETISEKYLKPKLGTCYITAIDSGVIEALTHELLFEQELAPKTVKDILIVLQSVLKYAAKHYPGIYPPLEIVYPKEVRKETRVLTREEQAYFVQYLLQDIDSCKFGVLLALLTGIRIGELCALQWKNISIKEKTVKIAMTMQRLRDMNPEGTIRTKILIGAPKSSQSFRVIPLTDYISALCEQMNPHNPDAYILTGLDTFMEPRTLQYRMEKYTKACSLEGVHFHTLRHTFATRCVEVGFEIKSLSEILGHSTTTITLDRYVHSSFELKRQNMNKLDSIDF